MQRTRALLADLFGNHIQWLQDEIRLLEEVLAAELDERLSEKLTIRLVAAQARMAWLERTRLTLAALSTDVDV